MEEAFLESRLGDGEHDGAAALHDGVRMGGGAFAAGEAPRKGDASALDLRIRRRESERATSAPSRFFAAPD